MPAAPLPAPLPASVLRKQQVAQGLRGDLEGVPGTWLPPTQPLASIWEKNYQVEELCLSFSDALLNKSFL